MSASPARSRLESPHHTLPLAHGMGVDTVLPDWPPLTVVEVAGLLRHYPDAGAVRGILSHSPRPFSAASVVATVGGSRAAVFVKRHHARVRSAAQLEDEHAFMDHLRRNGAALGVGICEVLVTGTAARALTLGEWTYEVHGLAPGLDVYREAPSWTPFQEVAHAEAAGRVLARLHQAAAGFDRPHRAGQPLVSGFTLFAGDDPLAAMADYVAARPALADYLSTRPWRDDTRRLLLPFHDRLRPHLGHLAPLWTHNDLHASNLTWTGAGPTATVAAVLDFGLADRTTALYDLATAIERNTVEWLALTESRAPTVHHDQVAALLAGYHAVSPLGTEQRQALAALLPLVHAEFALAETDYFHGVTRSAGNAGLAYEGYFLSHADWFHGADGQALLAFIRDLPL
ncbi:phosphotransferase enzyme family protein [Nitrospirillum pindoramense]|uniref:Ser/Thr protein kinase RdoA (MazF antagonist) n=1 Tax=Nitrospirillum amazonense TaxID=28077 RepID=A0A560GWW1_9PROT|nr:phosphotransferase [Nitrospirillum amazonense]TWB38525.1 Ser/Thr protein kinase RdoA (MazF antagonist) [Nitrospirillum amazonense]